MLRHSSRSFESGLPKKQLIPASSDAAKVYLRMSGLESDAFKRFRELSALFMPA